MTSIFDKCRGRSKLGQAEILVAALFIIVISGVVIAQNATNITNFTGNIILNPDFGDMTNDSAQKIETTKTIEIFANSFLELFLNTTEVEENESVLIQAKLSLDNGSVLENQNINFFLDDVLIGQEITNSSGLANLEYDLTGQNIGTKTIRAEFLGDGYVNPSSDEEQVNIKTAEYEWISYDEKTDTIIIVGDGKKCTYSNPCRLIDIYNTDQKNGWNQIQNLYDYFVFNARLQIGDGKKETWLVSQFEHIYITKPWEVMPNSNLKFGSLTENEQPFGGVLFETNVSRTDELDHNSALKVHRKGSLFFYDSVYKVYSESENNLYLAMGSTYEANRFDIQRIHKSSVKTILNIPEGSSLKDYIKRKYVSVLCEDEEECKEILGGDE